MTDEPSVQTIDVHYLKSNSYREMSCDGLVGGPTPSNKVWIGFFSERLPVPQVMRHTLTKLPDSDQVTIDPNIPAVAIESKSGIIRNLEFGLYLNIDTAAQLRDWLDQTLKSLRGDEK